MNWSRGVFFHRNGRLDGSFWASLLKLLGEFYSSIVGPQVLNIDQR